MNHTNELQKKKILSQLIFERRKHFISYIPYHSQKKPYYDAISKGDTSMVRHLDDEFTSIPEFFLKNVIITTMLFISYNMNVCVQQLNSV